MLLQEHYRVPAELTSKGKAFLTTKVSQLRVHPRAAGLHFKPQNCSPKNKNTRSHFGLPLTSHRPEPDLSFSTWLLARCQTSPHSDVYEPKESASKYLKDSCLLWYSTAWSCCQLIAFIQPENQRQPNSAEQELLFRSTIFFRDFCVVYKEAPDRRDKNSNTNFPFHAMTLSFKTTSPFSLLWLCLSKQQQKPTNNNDKMFKNKPTNHLKEIIFLAPHSLSATYY